jgi:hypothetical protein
VTDVLKGVVGKSAFLVPWIFAAAIGLGAASLFLLPAASALHLAGPIGSWDTTTKGLVLFTAAVLIGFTMGAASTPLYRLLEGYVGPSAWWQGAAERQRTVRRELQKKLDEIDPTTVQAALLYEKLDRFPADERQMAPTRLGNALRAFETYGVDRYQLDSQLLWYELVSVIPKKLQDELDNSRAGTDFFVAMVYITATYGLTSLALFFVAIYNGLYLAGLGLWIGAVLAILAFPLMSYGLAVSSTTYWATTVRAMVNLGRTKLAEQYGLEMPRTIARERRMWQALGTFLFYRYSSTSGTALNAYRIKPKPSKSTGEDTTDEKDDEGEDQAD